MKRYQVLKLLFLGLALLLSHAMCAETAYNYCSLKLGFGSAPASVAFLTLIPYTVGILICLAFAWFFHRKHRCSMK